MKLEIPYGKRKIKMSVPDKNIFKIIYPKKVKIQNEYEVLLNALKKRMGSKSLKSFLQNTNKLLIIVNDGNRPTPTTKVLDVIYKDIKKENLKFLIATGVHTAPSKNELRKIFGKYYERFKELIIIHDSKKDEEMVYLGKTKKGTELHFNRLVMEADKIISISSVEPHYFAGFTGGRKSFLPGIAGYRTIEQNHKYALSPRARSLSLRDNPVHQDMFDAIERINPERIFTIQLVLDQHQHIVGAATGNIQRAFEKSTTIARKIFCVKIPQKTDIVITVARPPFDRDLYQTLKAIENGKLALKKNGILIVVSPCHNGLGPPNFSRFFRNPRNLQTAVRHARHDYRLGDHNAVNLSKINHWAKIWVITEIEHYKLTNANIKPFTLLQEAINNALREKNHKAKILILIDGSLIVPL